jgi:hypothetical protein
VVIAPERQMRSLVSQADSSRVGQRDIAIAFQKRRLPAVAQSDSSHALSVGSTDMSERAHFAAEEARAAGERIGIDWTRSSFDVGQFRMGMDVELEHGTRDPETNVTDDEVTVTAKIARAHLNEFPDYYSRLAIMESEADAYWAAQGE